MVQDLLAIRMEKIWHMAEIAHVQGHVNAQASGLKTVEFSGLIFCYEQETLVRIYGPYLDISIDCPAVAQDALDKNILRFPTKKIAVMFNRGADADLDQWYGQCLGLAGAIAGHKKAA